MPHNPALFAANRARRALAEFLEPRRLLAAVSWDGGGDSLNWHDPLNWSGDVLPGPADDVTIFDGSASGGVTISTGDNSIRSLRSYWPLNIAEGSFSVAAYSEVSANVMISGGELGGEGLFDVTSNKRLVWTGGRMVGSGITKTGHLSLEGPGEKALGREMRASSTRFIDGTLRIGVGSEAGSYISYSRFNIEAGADGIVAGTAAGSFFNDGFVEKFGPGEFVFPEQIPFDSQEDVIVTEGTLTLKRGFANTAGGTTASNTCRFVVADGATLRFGDYEIARADIDGFGNSRLEVDDVLHVGAVRLGGELIWGGGTIEKTDPQGYQHAFYMSPDAVIEWESGTVGPSAAFVVSSRATLNVRGEGPQRVAGLLVNMGTLNYHGAGLVLGSLDGSAAGTFRNGASTEDRPVLNLHGDVRLETAATGVAADNRFVNYAVVNKKESGTAEIVPGVTFDNLAGSVRVDSGTLSIQSSAQIEDDALTGGNWRVAAGAELAFSDTIVSFTTNGGNVTLSGAGASLLQFSHLSQNRGRITVENGATFTPAPPDGWFTNAGELLVHGSSATFNNFANGTGEKSGSVELVAASLSASEVVNHGRIDVAAAGRISIAGDYAQTGTGTLASTLTATENGFVDAGQTASLAGTVEIIVSGYDEGTAGLRRLVAAGNVTGTFDVVAVGRTPSRRGVGVQYTPDAALASVKPLPPGTPDLLAGSDTGITSSDNVTRDTTPTVQVASPDAGLVRLFLDGVEVTSQWVDAGGAMEVTLGDVPAGSGPLAEGEYLVTASVTDAEGDQATADEALRILIDTTSPQVTSAQFVYEMAPVRIAIAFTEYTRVYAYDGMTVENLTSGEPHQAYGGFNRPPYEIEWLLTQPFTHAPIPDGNYRATLADGSITDVAGNVLVDGLTFDFFVLAGDTDRDRDVDFFDFLKLRANYGQTDKLFSDGDFDYDGDVDFFDFLILRGNYGLTLPPPEGSGSLFDDGEESGGL